MRKFHVKFITILLALPVMLPTLANDAVQTFTDVPVDHIYYADIEKCFNAGIISGYGEGLFGPGDSLLRVQAAIMILRAQRDVEYSSDYQIFDDVPPGTYYYDLVNLFAERQITSGCGNNNFCPLQSVTRAQLAVFLLRARGEYNPSSYPTAPVYVDVSESHWAYKFIQRASQFGWLDSCSAGHFCPDSTITRGEACRIFVRAFNL